MTMPFGEYMGIIGCDMHSIGKGFFFRTKSRRWDYARGMMGYWLPETLVGRE